MQVATKSEANKTLATSAKRFFAFIVDYSIVALLLMGAHPLFLPVDWDLINYDQVLVKLSPVYFLGILLLLLKDSVRGISLGKALLNIQVTRVDEGFTKPGFNQLLLRNLFILALPVEIYLILMDQHCRRLGDKFAGTMVIDHVKPPEVRVLTTKLVAVMLVFATLWMTFTLCIPVAIKKSSGYRMSEQAILNSSDVGRSTGEILSFGYWPEVNYKPDATIYKIKVLGQQDERWVQVVLPANISLSGDRSSTRVEQLRVLEKELD